MQALDSDNPIHRIRVEHWIVDLRNRSVHAYRDPDRFQRRYRQLQSLSSGELGLGIEGTEVRIDVGALLGA